MNHATILAAGEVVDARLEPARASR